ncbi:hypothetical protein AB3S75_045539 [Citrus x aurantiifolia]
MSEITSLSKQSKEDKRKESDEQLPAETITRRLKLYRAALNGDWAVAKEIYDEDDREIGVEITNHGNTALHVAAEANRIDFVKKLLKSMSAEDLAKQNKIGCTALFYAAASGSVELAKETMKDNRSIATLPDNDGMLPIVRAASLGRTEVVEFLYRETKNSLKDDDCIELLVQLIETGLYAVALQLLHDHRYLATKRAKNKKTALHALARKNLGDKDRKNKEAAKLVESLWEEVILLSKDEIWKLIEQPGELILDAAEQGNVQFLSILIREYPDLMWKADENDNYTIFHIAVSNRQEKLFKFIYDIRSIADLMVDSTDKKGNNILHLAGKLAPQHRLNVVSGSALQMQRELLWFEAVKDVVPPKLRDAKNNKGLTPKALFSKEHKELKRKGETWMKDTASSCMIVATLIATIVFAAAITVPGGNKEDTGLPFFRRRASFKIFAVSNVISLAASSVSIVNFLSIVAPRYAEEDFLHLLPRKLLVGFATLFVAIAAMMVVFSATSYIVFKDGSLWIAILAIVISSMPVILFVKQHFLFFYDVLRSTYASHYLIRKGKTSLFYKAGETTTTKHQWKSKLFNGSNLTIPSTSSCSTNV